MNDHVLDDMLEYLAGRLEDTRREEVERHLTSCKDCREQFSWAGKLRDEALANDRAHLSAIRILELAENPAVELSPPERGHLERCPDCRGEVDWARALPPEQEADQEVESPTHARRSFFARWWWAPVAVAAAAVAIILVVPPSKPPVDFVRLARIEALPVETLRDVPEADPQAEHRLRGLELYAAGDYPGAAASLEQALQLGADDVAALYLASGEMLQGRHEQALPRLRALAQSAEDPAVREEALWQLANAALATGAVAESEELLRRLVATHEYHAEDAAAQLAAIEAARE